MSSPAPYPVPTRVTSLPDTRRLSVIKIGGSVLTGLQAYRCVAAFLAERVSERPDEALVVVVSAEFGLTDSLLETARDFAPEPDPRTLDLLWSTGEIRSVALLVLALQVAGVRATGVSAHQTGLVEPGTRTIAGGSELRALRLRAALSGHDVVVAPGFVARGQGDALVSLGRGGSDLTAVLLAAGLGAASCELVKDVAGYFSSDPHVDSRARHLPSLTFARALEMSDEGCDLVQRHALEAARDRGMPLVVRALQAPEHTVLS
ncbi:MAG: hypothetical protein LC753_05550 [Acidobacteria bacterium]|nr:hypothetical protein [Acidobacteriota bacterium]